MRLGLTLLLLVVIPAEPVAGAALCVTNGTDAALHFTVEDAATGKRRAADLATGQSLCLRAEEGGTVAAFESARSIEGCSRLVPAGQNDTLLDFAWFDRCRWASHAPDAGLHD